MSLVVVVVVHLICLECSNHRIKGNFFSLNSRLKMFNLHCTNDRLNLNSLMSRLRLQHFETFSPGLVFLETFPILVLFSLCFPNSFTYFMKIGVWKRSTTVEYSYIFSSF